MGQLQQEAGTDEDLKRVLRAVDLVAVGIGATVGADIFVFTDQTAAKYGQPSIGLSFIFAAVIPLRFRTNNIAGGRSFLKKAPSPGPPSAKTFNISVLTVAIARGYRERPSLKSFLVEGFGEATSFKKGFPRILTFLTAHWYDMCARWSVFAEFASMIRVARAEYTLAY